MSRRKFLLVTHPFERRSELNSAIDNYVEEGPLGSVDRRIPICVEKLFSELHDENSSLAQSWTDLQITEWVGRLGAYSDDMKVARFGYPWRESPFLYGQSRYSQFGNFGCLTYSMFVLKFDTQKANRFRTR